MATSVRLEPIESNFLLNDLTYAALREAVLEVDVYSESADLRLDERKMAKQLGVSRTPLRDALTRLEQEGFITIKPRRGIFINRKSKREVLEMIIVWAALESMAARLACAVATGEDIAMLRQIGMQFPEDEAKANLSEYSEANIKFHGTIMRLSNCQKLQELGEELFTHLKPIRRRAMRDTSRADRSVVDHMKIIEAIEARNEELASDLVRGHTLRLHDYVRRTWKFFVGESEDLEAGR